MRQRLLVGETIGLDLVNTRWLEHGETVDFLADEGAATMWFREHGFDPGVEEVGALLAAREAVAEFLRSPGPAADDSLTAVLTHGVERRSMRDGHPVTTREIDPGWAAAWTAVHSFTDLLAVSADRIRQCAHPDCVLYFHDTSRNGGRRWHSMETCGARTKSARHYRKQAG